MRAPVLPVRRNIKGPRLEATDLDWATGEGVLKGRITIRLRDGDGEVVLGPGELLVVPVGVEHQPFAEEEAELLLIEPSGTPNTGNEATAARRVAI